MYRAAMAGTGAPNWRARSEQDPQTAAPRHPTGKNKIFQPGILAQSTTPIKLKMHHEIKHLC